MSTYYHYAKAISLLTSVVISVGEAARRKVGVSVEYRATLTLGYGII